MTEDFEEFVFELSRTTLLSNSKNLVRPLEMVFELSRTTLLSNDYADFP